MVQLNFSRLIEYESIGLHAVMEMLRVNLPLKLGMNDSRVRECCFHHNKNCFIKIQLDNNGWSELLWIERGAGLILITDGYDTMTVYIITWFVSTFTCVVKPMTCHCTEICHSMTECISVHNHDMMYDCMEWFFFYRGQKLGKLKLLSPSAI